MGIWRKIQIANIIFAVLAVGLTIVALNQPAFLSAAMWAWCITLWLFLFLVPLPVLERNKRRYKYLHSAITFVAIFAAIYVFNWFCDNMDVRSFSVGMLIYSVVYTIVALLFAGWYKILENKK